MGIWPSSIHTCWPSHNMRLCFSMVYRLVIPALSSMVLFYTLSCHLMFRQAPGSYFSCCWIWDCQTKIHENMDIICKEELLQALQNAGCSPVCPLWMLKESYLSKTLSWVVKDHFLEVFFEGLLGRTWYCEGAWVDSLEETFPADQIKMKVILSGCLCFIRFCCSWRERIMSVVALLVHTAILGRPSEQVHGGSSWQNKVVRLLSNRGRRCPVAQW